MTVPVARETDLDDTAGINLALLAALPDARNVLELGCSTGRLARRYKRAHPAASWVGVDISHAALADARPYLDAVHRRDLDIDGIAGVGSGFDLVVLGDVLEHLKQPEKLLEELRPLCTDDARLLCCMPNMSHVTVIERLIRGDIMYDPIGLLDATHLRFFSPRSVFKMFLDTGWLPKAAGGYYGGHPNPAFAQAVIAAAQALGIPQAAAELNVYTYQLIIDCVLRPRVPKVRGRAKISVVVAGDDEALLGLNVGRSPGLREIDAEIGAYRGPRSAAAAFADGAAHASGDWLLLCHPDVYFPRGAGFEMLAILDRIAAADAAATLIGFAGVGIDEALRPLRAGLAVDGRALHDFPACDRVVSIADWAVLMHRTSPLVIDPTLGEHLWATDLCLQSIYGPTARFPRIVRIPIFHNTNVDPISPAFAASAQTFVAKYPHLASISTLAAEIRNDGTLHAPAFATRTT